MKCKCGFKFAEAGEYRNCEAFVTKDGQGGVVCPDCDKNYVNGIEVVFREKSNDRPKNNKAND